MAIILLDPGHTEGYNRSPVIPAYAEGTRMWTLSVMLKKKLEDRGFKVYTTRPSMQDDPSLSQRGNMAGRVGADLFLSLHSNAPSKDPDGGYDTAKRGTVSIVSQADLAFNRPLADKFSTAVSTLMDHPDLGSFYKDYPNRPGVDYYGVLRHSAAAGCPRALIVEHGFHTNYEDCSRLMDDAFLEELANAEAQILAECFECAEPRLYRVQTGAYEKGENALKKQRKLQDKGFESVVSFDGVLYRVQAGAYQSFENARKKVEKLKEAGFDAIIVAVN